MTLGATQQGPIAWASLGARRRYGSSGLVHEQIARSAARTPHATAIVAHDGTLSYAELIQRSAALARGMLARGATPGGCVALRLPRGRDLLCAMVGALRAGCAFLPLSPEEPAARLAHMVELARPALCVGEPWPDARVTVLSVAELMQEPFSHGLPPTHDNESGAYVLFTSGSTGVPKGVAVTHAGFSNRLHWMVEHFAVSERDRVLHKTPNTFDVSLWEIFLPWMVGACTVVAEPGAERDPRAIADWVRRERITLLHFVPSLLEHALDELGPSVSTSLRHVILSGEALSARLAARARSALTVPVHNLYGPTEAAIDVTAWECVAGASDPLPIGQAIANMDVFVLDELGRPVTAGATGEICLSGVGLATGYVGDATATARQFRLHDLPIRGRVRVYHTGDLGHVDAHGQVIYEGRADTQIKLRGQRIEIGEIEAVIASHAAVLQVAVLCQDRRLHAFVVCPQSDLPEVREHAAARLPEAMRPAQFHALSALPLTRHGKLDRASLEAELGAPSAGPGSRALPPADPDAPVADDVMAHVLEAWREVLGWDAPLGDFFRCGGDSLRLLQLRRALEARTGQSIALRALFAATTPEAVARLVARPGSALPGAPELGPACLASGQRALWLHQQLEPRDPSYTVSEVFSIEGPLDLGRLDAALTRLIARHEALRFRCVSDEGELKAVVDPPAPFRSLRCDLSQLPLALRAQQAAQVRRSHLAHSFAPRTGRLFRAVVISESSERHQLLLQAHHSICDGWSIGTLLIELSALYADPAASLPEPVPFSVFARAEAQRLASLEVQSELSSVVARHGGGLLPLPIAPRHQDAGANAQVSSTALCTDRVERLRCAAQARAASLPMLELALFGQAVARVFDVRSADVVVPLLNRDEARFEGCVGLCSNLVLVRLEGLDAELATVLAGARAALLRAQAEAHLPFDLVIARFRHVPGKLPVPFLFNHVSHRGAALTLPGARVSWLASAEAAAKVALGLSVVERTGRCDAKWQFQPGWRLAAERTMSVWRELCAEVADGV